MTPTPTPTRELAPGRGTYDAWRVDVIGPRHFRPVLVDTRRRREFPLSVAGCARQAVYSATRMPSRPTRYLGASTLRAGTPVVVELDDACDRSPAIADVHDHAHAVRLDALDPLTPDELDALDVDPSTLRLRELTR